MDTKQTLPRENGPSLFPPQSDSGMMVGEPLVPLPKNLVQATEVRGVLIVLSRQSLRNKGYFDAYQKHLSDEDQQALSVVQTRDWISIDLAMSHYVACDALGLPKETMQELGNTVGSRLNKSVLGTIVRLATSVLSPVHGWKKVNQLWSRAFNGSAMEVWQLGPKKLQVQVHKCPLTEVRYFRYGLAGLIQGNTELFCKQATVRVGRSSPGQTNYHVSWT